MLRAAADQLSHARALPDPPSTQAKLGAVAGAFVQVMKALRGYVSDVEPCSSLQASDARTMTGWPRAALDTRLALDRAIHSLEKGKLPADLQAPTGSVLADSLLAAAQSLTTGRDLLQTHFGPMAAGRRAYMSEWAPVITSERIIRAVAAEVASCAGQLAPLAARIAQGGTARYGETPRIRSRLHDACQSLWETDRAVATAHFREPVEVADLELLHSIPLNSLPARAVPRGGETVRVLCEGIMSTAERVRQATWQQQPAWSTEVSATSLRHTAASGVVISHNCEVALAALARQAQALGMAEASAFTQAAAGAAGAARSRWLETARAWGTQIVTDTSGQPQMSRVCVETEDLAVWTGRLIYLDPRWRPNRGRSTHLRPPEQLAPQPEDLQPVMTAVQSAAETLSRLAEAELGTLRSIAGAGRLYVPARTLPEDPGSPRRYGQAPPERVEDLAAIYQATGHDSSQLALAVGADVAPRAPRSAVAARSAGRTGSAGKVSQPAEGALQGPVVTLLRQLGVTRPDLLEEAADLQEEVSQPAEGALQGPVVTLLRQLGVTRPDLLEQAEDLQDAAGIPARARGAQAITR